ncbi:sugar ABC transporter substrate-binding protein [Kocuria sp. cx-116]|uniref:ABC transporter substrate-binding protein n=1 Tax=Kocuria sp. cx-116 TaxID=2771378 RepID=UPI001682DA1B|nr:sugar ABC transporter substrate-binding protein [Kocuria sp. cx-116]MBD2762760.1 sugar ABC transporter substrate-binding protein [Kocuria sp. cx-116]
MRHSTAAPGRTKVRNPTTGRRGVWWQALLLALFTGFAMTGCSASADETKDEIVVAIVSNPQMQDAMELQDEFAKAHPDVNVKFVSLPENEARAKITASVATGGGEFDVVMISNYETPIWAENGWIENLQPYIDKTEGYDDQDFIGSIREALSYEDDMYSVPFYGESSFLVYNEEMFKNAGVTMPKNPTWPQINELAAKLDDPDNGVSGICLRGLAGWGEVMAPLSTVMNTYGGGWFDQDWNPTLTSDKTKQAVDEYVNLVREHGQPGAATSGYGDCITRYSQGNAAMWYDATAMVSSIEDPASSTVAGKNGYAPAPVMDTEDAGWLYSWSLAIPSTSDHKDAAWDFVSWMTNKDYIQLVGERFGWERVPPGSRYSTYQVPEYRKISQAYAQPTLDAMDGASQETSMTHPVPYDGLQFVAIPEFQDLGTRVGQQISAAVAGQITVDEALEQSQAYAEQVARTYQREEGQ